MRHVAPPFLYSLVCFVLQDNYKLVPGCDEESSSHINSSQNTIVINEEALKC